MLPFPLRGQCVAPLRQGRVVFSPVGRKSPRLPLTAFSLYRTSSKRVEGTGRSPLLFLGEAGVQGEHPAKELALITAPVQAVLAVQSADGKGQ